MTAGEKASVLHNVMAKVASAERAQPAAPSAGRIPAERVPTPYLIPGLQIWIERHRFVGTVMAALLVVVITGSGVALAAEKALPGDALYAVKVAVTEPIRTAMQTSPEAQAAWQSHLASERLDEAEALAATGRLDEPKKQELETLLAQHTAAFEVAVNATEKTDASSTETMAEGGAEGKAGQATNDAKPTEAMPTEAVPTEAVPVSVARVMSVSALEAPSKSDQLKAEFRKKLRAHADALERISHESQGSTTQAEITGVVRAARNYAEAVQEHSGSTDHGNGRPSKALESDQPLVPQDLTAPSSLGL